MPAYVAARCATPVTPLCTARRCALHLGGALSLAPLRAGVLSAPARPHAALRPARAPRLPSPKIPRSKRCD